MLVNGAAGTFSLLERVAAFPFSFSPSKEVEDLEDDLRRQDPRLAYSVWPLYGIIMVIIFIALPEHSFQPCFG
ncbi:MAG: hypothetical protein K0U98_07815 [Deltaproteobacteria bacterium]|nr:hypothetical protein [Deltaproteobacteria bacterium]